MPETSHPWPEVASWWATLTTTALAGLALWEYTPLLAPPEVELFTRKDSLELKVTRGTAYRLRLSVTSAGAQPVAVSLAEPRYPFTLNGDYVRARRRLRAGEEFTLPLNDNGRDSFRVELSWVQPLTRHRTKLTRFRTGYGITFARASLEGDS